MKEQLIKLGSYGKKKSYKNDHVQIGESKKRKKGERVSYVPLAQHPYSHFIQKMQLELKVKILTATAESTSCSRHNVTPGLTHLTALSSCRRPLSSPGERAGSPHSERLRHEPARQLSALPPGVVGRPSVQR